MSETSGLIVEYKNKDGSRQKAIMRHADQKSSFKQIKKALLRLLNDDMTEKKDGAGKKIISLRDISELTQIGYID